MADQGNANEWSQRIERALSGTTLAQFRELIDGFRDELSRMVTRDDLAGLVSRDDLAGLASREDLVRGLEAIASSQRVEPAPVLDTETIKEVVASQAERILGGFAQRVGQLQTAITQTQESLLARIEQLETRIPAEADLRPAFDPRAVTERVDAAVDDLASSTRAALADVSSMIEQLARKVDGLSEAVPRDATDGSALDGIRDELRALEVSLRTEIDAGFRSRDESETKQVDALGLRVTNLSMSVTQALEAVRAQAASMQERAERLEAEQAAILAAIKEEVTGIGGTVAKNIAGPAEILTRNVAERLDSLGALAATLGSLDERLAAVDQLLERTSSNDGIEQRVASAVAAAVEPLQAMRDEVRELSDQAIQLGALPQIEAQLRRVEDALGPIAAVPERLEALAGSTERLDALTGIGSALERMQQDVAAIPSLREQVRALAEHPADDQRLDAITDRLEQLDARLASLDLAALEQKVEANGARMAALAGMADKLEALDGIADKLTALSRVEDVAQMLAQVGARLDELPTAAAEAINARVDGAVNELWTIVERLPATVDERMGSLRDRIEQRLEGLHVDLGDVEQVRQAVDGLLTTARANEQRLVDTASQLDAVAADVRDEVGRALGRVSVRLDGIEAAVARTILDVRAALEDHAKISSDAVDRLGDRVGGLDDRLEAIDRASSTVRGHIEAMPSPGDLAHVVTREVTQALTTFRAATEARIAGVERDLGGVATNVNEIWMRARVIGQALEDLGSAIEQQVGTLGERVSANARTMGEVLEGEGRTAQRIAEIEQRFVAAARAIESERDRVFVQAFEEILDRLSKDERRLAKRLRGFVRRRKSRDDDVSSSRDDVPDGTSVPSQTSDAPVIDLSIPPPAATPSRARSKPKKPATTKNPASKRSPAKKNLSASDAASKPAKPAASKRTTAKKTTAKASTRAPSRSSSSARAPSRANGTKRSTKRAEAPASEQLAPPVPEAPTEPSATE